MSGPSALRSGLASLVGGGTGAVFGLLLAVVVGRGLGPEGAGFFFQLVAFFMIAANVLELGADTGLVRALSRQLAHGRDADLRRTVAVAVVPVVAVGVLVSAAILLLAPALGALLSTPSAAATTTELITSTALFVLPASLLMVLLGGTRGLGRILPFIGLFNITLPVGRVLAVLLVFGAGWGLAAAAQAWAWPFVIACAVAVVVLARQLSRTARRPSAAPGAVAPTPTRELAREFWSFTAPRGIAAALEIALAWVDVLLVAALLGPAAAGVYAVVSRAGRSGLLVETAMRTVVSAPLSAALAAGERAEARRLYLMASRAMVLLAWPLYITLALFAGPVLSIFGSEFRAGVVALAVLSIAMMVLSAAGLVQSVLLMSGRSAAQVRNKACALAISVVGNVVLLPLLGITGAAATWIIVIVVDAGLAAWQVRHILAVRSTVRELATTAAVVLVAVGAPGLLIRVTLGVSVTSLLIQLAVAAALLAAACWLLRCQLGLRDMVSGPLQRFGSPSDSQSSSSSRRSSHTAT